MPQLRGALATFVSQTLPHTRKAIRTRPLQTRIGAYMRGLSNRDVERVLKCQVKGGRLSP